MFPSLSTILSGYASISAIIMLLRPIISELIPETLQNQINKKFSYFFSYYFSTTFTFIIEDRWKAVDNETYRAVEAYLPTRVGPTTESLILGSNDSHDLKTPPKTAIAVNSEVKDEFEGIVVTWIPRLKETKKSFWHNEKRYFELTCKKKSRKIVMEKYIPYVLKTAEEILNNRENLDIYTYDQDLGSWESTDFKHPSTFETLAMEPDLKKFIMEDLDVFTKRKDYFHSVGRAWKRGYLLHGQPGTGKSSLVAAIANYLRYDIYDLQLQSVKNDAVLRRLLTTTTNKSILLIEDIDCSTKISHDRSKKKILAEQNQQEDDHSDSDNDNGENHKQRSSATGATLSGLLNLIDGLWSSCGDERIIIFTTNHKEKLDPALLRPGRMDVHVYMGNCSPLIFRKLVNTYLGIKEHELFSTIEDLIKKVSISPAEVAQQLMKRDKPLQSLVKFINRKEKESKRSKNKLLITMWRSMKQ
ncbi:AAA-ATPase At1g43910-like [Rutidosis leptorrhynchoides]|uniref:AAA-ATPase At1g43910-like n=1 Tax=Rutidosis leptorrhynchoides TaxID=125765 RepID=UPI003A9A1B72